MRPRARLAALVTTASAGLALVGAAPAQAVNCASFKTAVQGASNGATITLDAGLTCNDTYQLPEGHSAPFSITIQGGGAGATLDGNSLTGPIMHGHPAGGNQLNVTIRNLTFTRGEASSGSAISLGSGDVSATLENDRFFGNHSSAEAGAIDINSSASTRPIVVTGSTFGDRTLAGENTAVGDGGALRILGFGTGPAISVTHNTFDGNTSGADGGAAVLSDGAGDLTVSDNAFLANRASGSGGAVVIDGTKATFSRNRVAFNNVVKAGATPTAHGGGLSAVGNGSQPVLTQADNDFDLNTVGLDDITQPDLGAVGGGEFVIGFSLTSRRDHFARNTLAAPRGNGEAEGGGLAVEGCSVTPTKHRLEGDVVTGNSGRGNTSGAGVYAGGCSSGPVALTVLDSTIAGNSTAGGTAGLNGGPDDSLTLRNSIVAGNKGAVDLVGFGAGRTVTHSDACAPAVLPGAGNICADPLLLDPFHGNGHEKPISPTVDAGAAADIAPGLTTDYDGDPRTMGARVDMGADEFRLADDPFKGAVMANQKVKVKNGVARVLVNCPAAIAGPCTGNLTLRSKGKIALHKKDKNHKKKPQHIKLGGAAFSIGAGQTMKIPVKITKGGRKALKKRKGKLTAIAGAAATDRLGVRRTSEAEIKLRLAKKKPKKHHVKP